MYFIEVKIEDAIKEFSIIKDWLDVASKNILCADIDLSTVKSVYAFLLVKTENDRVLEMNYDERLQFELSKVRINIDIQIGKNFILGNRLPLGYIPDSIIFNISEMTKVKMIVEAKRTGLTANRDSIPNIADYSTIIEQLDNMGTLTESQGQSVENYDMDDILDKISSSGMNSLTEGELNFLKSKSNDKSA